jgi:VanZ family protein
VLSIMAYKVCFSELKKWIPAISRYRFNIAWHHLLLHGRGTLPQSLKHTRLYVKPDKLEHFLT